MNDDLAARIRLCADLAGSGDELARLTAIPRRTLEYYLTGQSEPKVARCVDIAKAAGVNIGWLASGEGAMHADQAIAIGGEEFDLVPLSNVEVSAGHGRSAGEESHKSHMAFRRDWLRRKGLQAGQLTCVYARGDSMEPLVCNDNLLLVDLTRTSVAEGIYVLRVQDNLFVKRLQQQMDGSVRVISENPAYESQVVPKVALDELHVIGRVVWCARDM